MSDYKMTCPYCGESCQADWVDVEVGLIQCGPFFCDNCFACQIGPYDKNFILTDKEKKYGWYEPGRSHLTSAPTLNGMPVDHNTAKSLYDINLLDEKL